MRVERCRTELERYVHEFISEIRREAEEADYVDDEDIIETLEHIIEKLRSERGGGP